MRMHPHHTTSVGRRELLKLKTPMSQRRKQMNLDDDDDDDDDDDENES